LAVLAGGVALGSRTQAELPVVISRGFCVSGLVIDKAPSHKMPRAVKTARWWGILAEIRNTFCDEWLPTSPVLRGGRPSLGAARQKEQEIRKEKRREGPGSGMNRSRTR